VIVNRDTFWILISVGGLSFMTRDTRDEALDKIQEIADVLSLYDIPRMFGKGYA
jgi:hypothetical protein